MRRLNPTRNKVRSQTQTSEGAHSLKSTCWMNPWLFKLIRAGRWTLSSNRHVCSFVQNGHLARGPWPGAGDYLWGFDDLNAGQWFESHAQPTITVFYLNFWLSMTVQNFRELYFEILTVHHILVIAVLTTEAYVLCSGRSYNAFGITDWGSICLLMISLPVSRKWVGP